MIGMVSCFLFFPRENKVSLKEKSTVEGIFILSLGGTVLIRMCINGNLPSLLPMDPNWHYFVSTSTITKMSDVVVFNSRIHSLAKYFIFHAASVNTCWSFGPPAHLPSRLSECHSNCDKLL